MQVLILHGILGRAGENWGQWLHDKLIRQGIDVLMPSLPEADHPDRRTWLAAIQEVTKQSNPTELVIVAHSLGVTSALDYVETLPTRLHGLVSVSGFAEDYGLELNSYFLREKTVDFAKVEANLGQAAVLYGDDDPYVPQATLKALADDLNVRPLIFPKGGHLNTTAGFTEFPQLLGVTTALARGHDA